MKFMGEKPKNWSTIYEQDLIGTKFSKIETNRETLLQKSGKQVTKEEEDEEWKNTYPNCRQEKTKEIKLCSRKQWKKKSCAMQNYRYKNHPFVSS